MLVVTTATWMRVVSFSTKTCAVYSTRLKAFFIFLQTAEPEDETDPYYGLSPDEIAELKALEEEEAELKRLEELEYVPIYLFIPFYTYCNSGARLPAARLSPRSSTRFALRWDLRR